MHIGCHLPTQGPVATREALLTFCRQAEEHHIASLWVSDHVVFPKANTGGYSGGRFPHAPETPYLEPVAVLAAAAMCTERARIGASVFILGHRFSWSPMAWSPGRTPAGRSRRIRTPQSD